MLIVPNTKGEYDYRSKEGVFQVRKNKVGGVGKLSFIELFLSHVLI